MSEFLADEHEEALLEKLLALIQEGRREEAISAIFRHNVFSAEKILDLLARELGDTALRLRFHIALAAALNYSDDIDHKLPDDIAKEIFDGYHRDSVNSLALVVDLARGFVHQFDRALARDDLNFDFGETQALEFEGVLKQIAPTAHEFASGIDTLLISIQTLIPSYLFGHYVLTEKWRSHHYRKLADALDEGLYLQQQNPSPIISIIAEALERHIAKDLQHITLESATAIAPDILAAEVTPYLEALNQFLGIHHIVDRETPKLRLAQIHNQAAQIEMTSVDIRAVMAFIYDKQQGQESALRKLRMDEKEFALELQVLDIELNVIQLALKKENRAAEDQTRYQELLAKIEPKILKARQNVSETAQQKMQLEQEISAYYIEKAYRYAEKHIPDLEFEQGVPHITRLADAMKRMGRCDVRLRYGWHDTPRPH